MTLARALKTIALSTLPLMIISGVVFYFRHTSPPDLTIEGLKMTSDLPVPGHYLAEILDLSVDQKISFSQFDCKEGQRRLLATHSIEKAVLSCVKPHLLSLQLQFRKPVALLGDFTRTGIDANGVLFPLDPCYPDLVLPTLFLGSLAPDPPWGRRIEQQYLIPLLADPTIKMIDWSKSLVPSLGKRAVVIETRRGDLIRMFPNDLETAMKHYHQIEQWTDQFPLQIDLRLPQMAFIKNRLIN